MTGFDVMMAIRGRRSVRTFDRMPLREEDAERILECARQADSPYGIPIEWRILSASEHGLSSAVITGAGTYIAGKMKEVPHAEEAFGWSFEKAVLFAQSLGVGTTWMAGTLNRPAFNRAMDLREGEVLPCVSPLGYPAAKMSVIETVMRRGMKNTGRMDFGKLFFDGSLSDPLTPEKAGDLRLPLEMVRLAPSAVNRQPWRVVVDGDRAYFYESKALSRIRGEGWDMQKIDMGIAMCHFALSLEELGMEWGFRTDAPSDGLPEGICPIGTFTLL